MKREHDQALALSDRALEDRPSCQAAWGLKANILNFCGMPEEATPLAKQSLRLSPVAQTFFPEVLATAHYLCGRREEAIATSHESLALAPDSVDARVILSASLAETEFTLARFAASRPYRDPAVLKRLVDSLRRAGLPDGVASASADIIELARPQATARRRIASRPRR
jgi:tetratricopeptide (TPR) repeat protein